MDISALIFDFDGTILDTETPVFEEWRAEYRHYGHDLEISFWGQRLGTHGVFDIAANLAELLADGQDPEAIRHGVRSRVRQRLTTQSLRPGIASLLDDIQEAELPLAIASSSSAGWVEGWLEHYDIRARFGPVCGRDHVERVKPEPDLFLLAAERLGVAPAACLVIEDSANGILAARNAGMRCVAVPNPITRQLDMPEAELKVESLEGLSLEEMLRRVGHLTPSLA